MQGFDLKRFMSENSLSVPMAAKVLKISRRTVYNWRKNAHVSGPALHLLRTIERQAPPWNNCFRRRISVGAAMLAYEWRVDLFGKNWFDAARRASESVDQRNGRRRPTLKDVEAARAKMRKAATAKRRASALKAWETRRARAKRREDLQQRLKLARRDAGGLQYGLERSFGQRLVRGNDEDMQMAGPDHHDVRSLLSIDDEAKASERLYRPIIIDAVKPRRALGHAPLPQRALETVEP